MTTINNNGEKQMLFKISQNGSKFVRSILQYAMLEPLFEGGSR